MAGTVREAKLQNPTARKRLRAGRQPHWNSITPGNHLGYQRKEGDASGRWVLRRRRSGEYATEPLGIADDHNDADGVSILDFQHARAKAVELSMDETRPAGRITVSRAMADYIDYLSASGKLTSTAESAAVNYILPKLGHCEVAALTAPQIRAWVAWMAESPAMNGGILGHDDLILDDERVRRRRVSANRYLAILKSALNHCFDEGRVSSNVAWSRRVRKFRNVASGRARYLTMEESRRFLDGCDDVFRPLARAALETGCRYSELARLEVSDFDKTSGTVHIRKSKAARQRRVVLTSAGTSFFSDLCAGRQLHELMFVKADGARWTHGAQGFYVREANRRGAINPPVTFHTMRHTWASLAVMGGVPLTVVARNLGHSTTRMVETTYGHLGSDYIADAIRRGAPRFV
jgi:integrase